VKITQKLTNKVNAKEEAGSLILAIILIFLIMLLATVMIADIAQTEDISLNSYQSSQSINQSNAGISDAAYQIDQLSSQPYPAVGINNPPLTLCVSTVSPPPTYSLNSTTGALTFGTASSPGSNTCTSSPTTGQGSWTYTAQLWDTATNSPFTSTTDPFTGGTTCSNASATEYEVYKVVSIGYSPSGQVRKSREFLSYFTGNVGGFSTSGMYASGGGVTFNSTNAVGTDACTTGGNGTFGLNAGGICSFTSSGINGSVSVFGPNLNTTTLTDCSAALPTGTPPLDPANPQDAVCPAPLTIPQTPCLPSNPAVYAPGCSPTSSSCCPTNATFGGSTTPVAPGVYICDTPVTLVAPLVITGGGTGTNNGVVQIFDFDNVPGSSITPGGQAIAMSGPGIINELPGTTQIGPSTNLLVDVAVPNPPTTNSGSTNTAFCNSNNYLSASYISMPSGSNNPTVSMELYLPNVILGINGAPFTNFTGNFVDCYSKLKGTGSDVTINGYAGGNNFGGYWIGNNYKE
jgi:Tfp pilus assembly protein PilX